MRTARVTKKRSDKYYPDDDYALDGKAQWKSKDEPVKNGCQCGGDPMKIWLDLINGPAAMEQSHHDWLGGPEQQAVH
jgi:hypothetical protein